MSHTLGDLVDRLSITNIKLWFVQDELHKANTNGTGVGPETVARSVNLNLERNRLMTEIDQCLADAAASGKARVDPRVKIT